MPKDHSQPINEADRQARAAFKAYADWFMRDRITMLTPIAMAERTYQRIIAGKRDVPPGAAREMAARIREDMLTSVLGRDTMEGWAMALELWADDCDERSKAARHA